MKNYEQAPLLLARGEKNRNGLFAYRPHELESAICCCLGNRDIVALKTMLFFTGNSNEGDFRVAQKTIFDRMNISEKPYYLAREKLQSMGWIRYVEAEKAIYINYDKIYADYKEYLRNKAEGYDNSTKKKENNDTAGVKELSEQSSNRAANCFQESQQDGLQDRYNNINNSKNNTKTKKISEKISGSASAARAALPQELIDKAYEYSGQRKYWDEYNNELEKWAYNLMKQWGIGKESPDYAKRYKEIEDVANRCLHVLHGEVKSIDEEYREYRY